MKRFTLAGLLMATTLMAGPATATELDYNLIELRYLHTDVDSRNGLGVALQGLVTPRLFALGSWSDSGVTQQVRLGGGYRHALHPSSTDLIAELAYVDIVRRGVPAGEAREFSGYGIGAGVRHLFDPNWEVAGRVDYRRLESGGGNDVSATLTGVWNYAAHFSLFAEITVEEDVNTGVVGWRIRL